MGKIAFISDRNGNPDLYIIDASGRNLRRLTRSTAADESPDFSPDGMTIAFASGRGEQRDIYLINQSTGRISVG